MLCFITCIPVTLHPQYVITSVFSFDIIVQLLYIVFNVSTICQFQDNYEIFMISATCLGFNLVLLCLVSGQKSKWHGWFHNGSQRRKLHSWLVIRSILYLAYLIPSITASSWFWWNLAKIVIRHDRNVLEVIEKLLFSFTATTCAVTFGYIGILGFYVKIAVENQYSEFDEWKLKLDDERNKIKDEIKSSTNRNEQSMLDESGSKLNVSDSVDYARNRNR